MDLAGRLADYVTSTKFGNIDPRTVKEMKARVVDAIGCAIGAFGERPIEMARSAVLGLRSGGPSSVIGTGKRTSPDLATFVNGFMLRYFDYNDTYLSREPAHPSDNIAPCLAVAESEGATGKELVSAAVAAYEVQCRLCDAADIRHRGWDHVNYGLVSSSLAAAKLMGLDAKKAEQAVNIAVSGHIAMRQVRAGELSMWKGASFANAARNGVFAAALAKDGVTGPSPVFEGEMGFFRQVSGPFDLDVSGFGGRGGRYKVPETYVKYWPAEYHAQSAIWAALAVRGDLKGPGEAKSVLVETHEAGYTILGKDPEKWHPGTKETADHSLPYIVGMALLEGKIDNETYSERNLRSARVLRFLRKVEVKEDPTLTAMYPAQGMANRVTVVTKSGAVFSKEVDVPRGHPLDPMGREELEQKFRALTEGKLSSERRRELLDLLWNLEEVDDLREVFKLMKVMA
ncbi:MAG: MmgE/PrpD family protein [Nitrososphaerota archaeon]|jgi:2-methylcitrate dehydratase|nr:MmgE/PrpD family protein [Nitrososphaerota archaeon]MDG6942044.1 MmgE/PrpD family protein [Nitrososphaerota archaeon]MDG6942509.1 MmgE/PrpD family protein [Nitrososphaerota archaeon]MDG6948296.1 MmgE/PrpD family protein [Nitrososphaerota archaeon]